MLPTVANQYHLARFVSEHPNHTNANGSSTPEVAKLTYIQNISYKPTLDSVITGLAATRNSQRK